MSIHKKCTTYALFCITPILFLFILNSFNFYDKHKKIEKVFLNKISFVIYMQTNHKLSYYLFINSWISLFSCEEIHNLSIFMQNKTTKIDNLMMWMPVTYKRFTIIGTKSLYMTARSENWVWTDSCKTSLLSRQEVLIGLILSRCMFLPTCQVYWLHTLCGLAAFAELCGVCPAFDLWGDGSGILISAVMTAEILYYRPLPPHYSPLTFTAPQLE